MPRNNEEEAQHLRDLMVMAMGLMPHLPHVYEDAVTVLNNMRLLLDQHLAVLRAVIPPSDSNPAPVVVLRSVVGPRP